MSDSYHFTLIFVINRKVIPTRFRASFRKIQIPPLFFFFFPPSSRRNNVRVAPFKSASSHFSDIRPSFIVLPEVYVSVSRASRSPTRKPCEWVKGSPPPPGPVSWKTAVSAIKWKDPIFSARRPREFASLTLGDRISQTRELVCVSHFPNLNNYLPFVFPS